MGISIFGVEMSIWGWSILLLGVAMVGVAQARADDDAGAFSGVGDSRIGSIGWGIVLAGVAYVAYLSYTAADAANAISWAIGPGRVWFGLGVVFYGGYIWTSVSADVDSREGMVSQLQEAVRGPILQFGGIVSTILITVAVGAVSFGLVAGDILGFGLGLFADSPGFGAAIVGSILGFVSMGGELPLVDPFVPDQFRNLNPAWWLAIMAGLISLALGFASDNFREGAN